MIIDKISDICSESILFKLTKFIPQGELYLKLEGLNIASSIKIKSARAMIENLEKYYCLIPNKTTLICSSSGNLGIAASILCKEMGYNFICVSDPNISFEASRYIKLFGGELKIVKKKDKNGGYLASRLELISKILKNNENTYFLNQYEDISNALAHYRTTAPELRHDLPTIDYLFIGAGTTGTLAGCAQYFSEYSPNTKIIAVDALGSVTFGGQPKKRRIPGLGTSKKPPLADMCRFDQLVVVSEDSTINMCNFLLKKHGLFVGGSTGSILVAVKNLQCDFNSRSIIAAISPDFGHKYIETIYNQEWVKENFFLHTGEM